MARFFQSKYSGDQIEKALNTMLSPTSDNKFGVSSVNGQVGAVTNVGMLPVGAIYMSYVDISPATFIEGSTWERITDRVLIGAGNLYPAGSTGGSATHKHSGGTLGAEITISSNNIIINTTTQQDGLTYNPIAELTTSSRQAYTDSQNYISPVIGNTSEANGLPPYLAVYIWRRIA